MWYSSALSNIKPMALVWVLSPDLVTVAVAIVLPETFARLRFLVNTNFPVVRLVSAVLPKKV